MGGGRTRHNFMHNDNDFSVTVKRLTAALLAELLLPMLQSDTIGRERF